MRELKFIGVRPNNEVANTTNREWSISEMSGILCYKAPNVDVERWEMAALVTRDGVTTEFDVLIMPIGDNVYLASQAANAKVYISDNLQDCLDTAALMVWES